MRRFVRIASDPDAVIGTNDPWGPGGYLRGRKATEAPAAYLPLSPRLADCTCAAFVGGGRAGRHPCRLRAWVLGWRAGMGAGKSGRSASTGSTSNASFQ